MMQKQGGKRHRRTVYQRLDEEIKSSLRNDKWEWPNNVAQEAKDAAMHGQMKGVYVNSLRPF